MTASTVTEGLAAQFEAAACVSFFAFRELSRRPDVRSPSACSIDLTSLPQKLNRVCSSSRRLFALSVNNPPEPAGWLARPKRGEVMSPKIGPGLL
jgi:hypothetical protein